MSQGKEDRRVRKTKKMLKKGLAALLAQKEIREITVKELTDYVDIHRGTFYFHYHDIYDLQESIQKETLEEIQLIFENNYPVELQKNPQPVLVAFNQYLSENAELCLLLLNNNFEFSQNLNDMIREQYLRSWLLNLFKDMEQENLEYCCAFVMSGFMAMVKYWLTCDMKITSMELADKMISVALNGLGAFATK